MWSLLSELGHLSRLTSLTADVLRDRSGLRQLASSAPGLSALRSLSLTVNTLAVDAGAGLPVLAAADLLFLSQLSALRELSIVGAVVRPVALPPLLFLTCLQVYSTRFTPIIASKLPAGVSYLGFDTWSGGGGGGGGADGPPAPAPCASVSRLSCTAVDADLQGLMAAFPSVISAHLLFYPPRKPPAAGWWLRSLNLERHTSASQLSPASLLRLLGDMSGLMELRVSTDGGCVDLGALLAAAPQLLRLSLETGALTSVDLTTSPALPRLPHLKWLRLQCPHPAATLTERGLLALGRAAPGLTRLQLSDDGSVERALAAQLDALSSAHPGAPLSPELLAARAVRLPLLAASEEEF